MLRNIIPFILFSLTMSSFTLKDKWESEYARLRKLEHRALLKPAGKTYIYDLTHKEGCNKTKITYLGIVHTRQGKRYKILTSFFVFSAASTCHGASKIKIYDMKNRYIGEYNVGMPDDLPDVLRNNKLLYVSNTKDCNLRKTGSINLSNGLPGTFFIPCSKNGGEMYTFDSMD